MNQKPRHNFVGYAIFTLVFLAILYIVICHRLADLNDIFTSILMIVFFFMAFFIFLANHGRISHRTTMNIIQKIPNYLPFKHTLENYLTKLIRKNFKVIVLIRTLDHKNHEWILNQISAYNAIMNNPALSEEELENIEFLFIQNNQNDVKALIEGLNTQENSYILISGLSAIFKEVILARENLNSEERSSIKIIGSLSSINDKNIQRIIRMDDDIIRIFPPDYDEAKTAMSFMFSKIKNSICSNSSCDFNKEKNNIIILHNGTYGQAVRDQCAYYFEKEFANLDVNTSCDFSVSNIDESIKFHSFDYKHNDVLIHDQSHTEGIEEFLEKWNEENVKNHFYLIGYEPNISIMLNYLDNALKQKPELKLNFYLLFAGTSSMNLWRERIRTTLSKANFLNASVPKRAYYLQLHTIQGVNSIHPINKLDLKICQYKINEKNKQVDIVEIMKELLKRPEDEINNMLSSYWKNENNYITTFTTDSLYIALHAIKYNKNLLESKSKVVQEHGRKTDILVNGDSINQYTVKILK